MVSIYGPRRTASSRIFDAPRLPEGKAGRRVQNAVRQKLRFGKQKAETKKQTLKRGKAETLKGGPQTTDY